MTSMKLLAPKEPIIGYVAIGERRTLTKLTRDTSNSMPPISRVAPSNRVALATVLVLVLH